jgi:UDP-GlcNAc:undecaprenyl-phosphate GlcNAc-1-phosphate transferase
LLGGLAVFLGFLFTVLLLLPAKELIDLPSFLAAFLIVVIIGLKDDLYPLTPYKKLIGQLMAALILIFKANVRISSLHGFMGVGELPEWASITFSLLTILTITNALNLIDGIDGLSGSIGALFCLVLGLWFWSVGQQAYAFLSFSLLGALIAFLRYNFSPASIFMGDSGSLLIGLTSSILIIRFLELHGPGFYQENPIFAVNATPAVAFALLIVPLFDALRVFTIRLLRGVSPLRGDRSHVHHLLVDKGWSHTKTTLVLIIVNLLFIIGSWALQALGTTLLIFLELGVASLLSLLVVYWKSSRKDDLSSEPELANGN